MRGGMLQGLFGTVLVILRPNASRPETAIRLG